MPDQINNVMTAEIPHKDEDPILYDTVARHMIHEYRVYFTENNINNVVNNR